LIGGATIGSALLGALILGAITFVLSFVITRAIVASRSRRAS